MASPAPPPGWRRLLVPLALLVVALAWRHQLGFWFTDTDTLADVAVARVDGPGDLWRQLGLPLTGGYGGLNANFYRPLTMLHFALQRALFGWEPLGWQAWDLGLHLAVLATFAAVLRGLGARRVEAALFVLVGGLHPVVAEVVPAVARSIDLLMSLLLGLSLLAVVRGRPLLAGLAALAALASKEPAIMAFPVVAGLWLHRRGPAGLPWLLGPWVPGLPLFLLVRARVLDGVGGYRPEAFLRPSGFWDVLAGGGLDALATPWATPLGQALGSGGWARHTVGSLAWIALGLLALLAWRRLGEQAVVGLALWGLPLGLLGLTHAYTRRLLYLPVLGIAMLLAGLLVRGGRLGRGAVLGVLLLLLPGTPLWRPYLDWGQGAEVSRESSVALEDELRELAGAAPGARLWLVDRPLRHNLDPRRAKFWRKGQTLNHGMGRYSLQAWLDERLGEDALVVQSLVAANPRVLLGEARAHLDADGGLVLPARGLSRLEGSDGREAGWTFEALDDGGMRLRPPAEAAGDGVLVFGRPGLVLRLP